MARVSLFSRQPAEFLKRISPDTHLLLALRSHITNCREKRPADGERLPAAEEHRYRGVVLSASDGINAEQEAHLRQSAQRASRILRRQCLWGCSRYLMMRELWNSVHVPGLTFANSTICLTAPTQTGGARCETSKGVQDHVRETERELWKSAMASKTTLRLHCDNKGTITTEPIYDNSGGSALLFEARAGVLRTLDYRSRTTMPQALGFHDAEGGRCFEGVATTSHN
ncbi:hypothetical protein HPB49_024495 [Dermacentor silvarum]|uniref:Uncharacterized protein n=1 Tax=Dermacentor silvarum TaxID=543639 RepID=A0ACB8D169_DERSI|nr:hypothetical protein HPB49_024495 [Dermacentor silvarum]